MKDMARIRARRIFQSLHCLTVTFLLIRLSVRVCRKAYGLSWSAGVWSSIDLEVYALIQVKTVYYSPDIALQCGQC